MMFDLDALGLLLAFTASLLSCTCFCLSQPQYWRKVFDDKAIQRPNAAFVRRSGWGLIAVSLGLCFYREDLSFAVLLWLLLFAVTALCIALVLAFRPRFLKPFGHGFVLMSSKD